MVPATIDKEQQIVKREEPTMLEVIRELAVDDRVNVEKLSALMQLQERAEAKEAEREFNAAFARLSGKLPRIAKNGRIFYEGKNGKQGMNQPYATYEDIDKAIRPLLIAEGFSLSFQSHDVTGGVRMTGILAHVLGHSRQSTMQLPADPSGSKNALQAIGSSRSYGKRYLVFDLLNIVTEGADDDGNAAECIAEEQVNSILDSLNALDIMPDTAQMRNFLAFAGVKEIEMIHRNDYERVIGKLREKIRKQQEGQ